MTGKTRNKLTFSKKKSGAPQKKARPVVKTASKPASVQTPPPPSSPPVAQLVHTAQPPVAAPVASPAPAASEAYTTQPTEHAPQIPTAQPVTVAPSPRSVVPQTRIGAPAAAESLKTSTSLPSSNQQSQLSSRASRAPGGKTKLRGRIVSQSPASSSPPSNFKETEDLKEQVGNYLEICDSCLSGGCDPTDVIDLIHVLVMSLNLNVVSMALIDSAMNGKFKQVVSRGYDIPPTREVVECWEMALTAKGELLWDKLMSIATDKKNELAYWIIKENLDSVGYVPIRDGKKLYGFILVASKTNKEQSILKSELLEACGSRLGLAYAEIYR